jgi:hypothetical protein
MKELTLHYTGDKHNVRHHEHHLAGTATMVHQYLTIASDGGYIMDRAGLTTLALRWEDMRRANNVGLATKLEGCSMVITSDDGAGSV